MPGPETITGLILAGGRGQRMGGADKGLILLDGRSMVEHVIARVHPQVSSILISANRNQERYAAFGFPVIADTLEDYLGPLAGIASASQAAVTDYIVTVPCDAPLVSETLVAGLAAAMERETADLAVAHDGQRLQPAFLLFKRTLLPDLATFLLAGGRSIEQWLKRHRFAVADFHECAETFMNVNDPLQHQVLDTRLRQPRP